MLNTFYNEWVNGSFNFCRAEYWSVVLIISWLDELHLLFLGFAKEMVPNNILVNGHIQINTCYRHSHLQSHNLIVYFLWWELYYKVINKLCYISLLRKDLLRVSWIFSVTVCLSDPVKFLSPLWVSKRTVDRVYTSHQWLRLTSHSLLMPALFVYSSFHSLVI